MIAVNPVLSIYAFPFGVYSHAMKGKNDSAPKGEQLKKDINSGTNFHSIEFIY